jgi:hypothetical protein
VKDSFYMKLESVSDKFPKYHMKIPLGDFNDKGGRKDIFKRQLAMKVYTKLVVIMELD